MRRFQDPNTLSSAIMRILWWAGQVTYPSLRILSGDVRGVAADNAVRTLLKGKYIKELHVSTGGHVKTRVLRLPYKKSTAEYSNLLYPDCETVFQKHMNGYLRTARRQTDGNKKDRESRRRERSRAARGLKLADTAAFLYGPVGGYLFQRNDGLKFRFTAGRGIDVYPGEGKPEGATNIPKGTCAGYLTYEVKDPMAPDRLMEIGRARSMSSRATGVICDGMRFYTMYMVSSPEGVAMLSWTERTTNDMLFRTVHSGNEETSEYLARTGRDAPGMTGAFFILKHYSAIRTLGSLTDITTVRRGRKDTNDSLPILNATAIMTLTGIGGGYMQEIYALPFSREGRALFSILLWRHGKSTLEKKLLYTEEEVLRAENTYVWHAIHGDGTKCFSFLAAEMIGLVGVLQETAAAQRTIKAENEKRRAEHARRLAEGGPDEPVELRKMFPVEISCYDFQTEDLTALLCKELGVKKEDVVLTGKGRRIGPVTVISYPFSEIAYAFQAWSDYVRGITPPEEA